LDEHLDRLRKRLLATARHAHGARVLMHEIYGVGAMTSLALCAWLGGADRFASARRAVRFVGRDITVHSSDNKRSTSGPGPTVPPRPGDAALAAVRGGQDLRPRRRPGYGYYTTVRERIDANRACLSQARRIVRQAVHLLADLGDEAFTIVAQPAAPSTITR
jgi:transposase